MATAVVVFWSAVLSAVLVVSAPLPIFLQGLQGLIVLVFVGVEGTKNLWQNNQCYQDQSKQKWCMHLVRQEVVQIVHLFITVFGIRIRSSIQDHTFMPPLLLGPERPWLNHNQLNTASTHDVPVSIPLPFPVRPANPIKPAQLCPSGPTHPRHGFIDHGHQSTSSRFNGSCTIVAHQSTAIHA